MFWIDILNMLEIWFYGKPFNVLEITLFPYLRNIAIIIFFTSMLR